MHRFTTMIPVLICLTGPAHCDYITNGSFEQGTFNPEITFAPGYTGTLVAPGSDILTGWSTALSPYDPDGKLTYLPNFPSGMEWTFGLNQNAYWVDLNRGGDLWSLSQSFATTPGQSYSLSYVGFAGNAMGGATTRVSLNGTGFDHTTSIIGGSFWQPFHESFVADAFTTTLTFSALSAGLDPLSGTQIDLVSVTAVPEPSILLSGSLLAWTIASRRSRR